MKKLFSLAACAVLATMPLAAQLSEGGQPRPVEAGTPIHLNLPFSGEDLRATSLWKQQSQLVPPQVGKALPVDIDFLTAATQHTIGEHVIYTLTLEAPEACGLSAAFRRLSLPKGGRLFAINGAGQVRGAFTQATCPDKGIFAIMPLPGSILTLQYEAPSEAPLPTIELEHLGYFFFDIFRDSGEVSPPTLIGEFSSQLCEVNARCSEGDEVKDQQNATVRIMTYDFRNDYSLCSGTVLNNTKEDFAPLILTAAHCGGMNTPLQPEEFAKWGFSFHYARPECTDNFFIDTQDLSMTGAELVCSTGFTSASDGLLLKLKKDIPDHYGVYYAGWDATGTAPAHAKGLHHPAGDVMKVSTATKAPTDYTYRDANFGAGADNAHWKFIYTATEHGHGVTEGGSSGSAIYNEQGLIVGTLTGGSSNCPSRVHGSNVYGKMAYHWDKGEDAQTHMAKYLDPVGNGATKTLKGKYKPSAAASPIPILSAAQAIVTFEQKEPKEVKISWSATNSSPEGLMVEVLREDKRLALVDYQTGMAIDRDPIKGEGVVLYSIRYISIVEGKEVPLNLPARHTAAYMTPGAEVTNLVATEQGGKTLLTWERPINYQLITPSPKEGSQLKKARKFTWPGINKYSHARVAYFAIGYSGADLPLLNGQYLVGIGFHTARPNNVHTYQGFARNGVNKVVLENGAYAYGPETPETRYLFNAPQSYNADEHLWMALPQPFKIKSKENFVVGIRVHSTVAFSGGDIFTMEAAPKLSFIATPLFSFDSRYFVGPDIIKLTPGVPAIEMILADTNTKTAALPATESIPSGVFPAAFPILKGYNIRQNGAPVATIADPQATSYEAPMGSGYTVEPIYVQGEVTALDPITQTEATPFVSGYPSPFTTHITLRGAEHVAQVDLLDLAGNVVLHVEQPSDRIEAELLASGNYLLLITLRNGSRLTQNISKR